MFTFVSHPQLNLISFQQQIKTEFDTVRHCNPRAKQDLHAGTLLDGDKPSFASTVMSQPAQSGHVFALKKRAATMSPPSVAACITMEGRHYFFNS